jgi:hypothetical protein
MFYLGGVASNAQDVIALMQARSANPGAAIPVIGADSFLDPVSRSTSGSNGPTTSTGSASPLLNSNVLGYLILTQSQNTGTAPTGSSPGQPNDFRQAFSQMVTAIQSGDLSGAQQAYAALGQFQPSNQGNQGGSAPSSPFAQGLGAIGQDLQNGNLSAAQQDLSSLEQQMQSAGGAHHHHHHHADASASQGASGTSGSDSGGLDQALTNLLQTDGTSSNTTNPDRSTTTTITYADGSKVTMTTAAPTAAATSATPGAAVTPTSDTSNVLETLIQLQAQLMAPASRSAT